MRPKYRRKLKLCHLFICVLLYIYIYIYIYIANTNEDKTHCKDHLYFDQLVGLRQGETHPDEDRQVGRNIGGLYNVSYLHLCSIYCFMRKTSTHIGCL